MASESVGNGAVVPVGGGVEGVRGSQGLRDILAREGVLVVAAPALAYGMAYAYGVGRGDRFGVPGDFLTVNLTDVLHTVGATFVPLWGVGLYVIILLDMGLVKIVKKVPMPAGMPLLGVPIVGIYLLEARARWYIWLAVLGFLIMSFVIPFAVGMIVVAGERGFRSRAKAASAMLSEGGSAYEATAAVLRLMGRRSWMLLLASAMLISLASISGYASAANQVLFAENVQTHEVLVAVDGNQLVMEHVVGNRLTGQFTLVPSNRSATLKLTDVGPLLAPKECPKTSC